MDRMSFEIDIERRRTDPAEPTIPGPTTSDTQRAYSADYDFAASHAALSPATLTDLNTIYANSVTGNDANPGTFASQKRTIFGVAGAVVQALATARAIIALNGTFRERGFFAGAMRIVGQPGQTPTIEAPDTYPAGIVNGSGAGTIATQPAHGMMLSDNTGGTIVLGSFNVPRSTILTYSTIQ